MEDWNGLSFRGEKRLPSLAMPVLPPTFSQNNIWASPDDGLSRRSSSQGISAASPGQYSRKSSISMPKPLASPFLTPSPFEEESILRMTHYEANYDNNYSLSSYPSSAASVPPWQPWETTSPSQGFYREDRLPRHASVSYHHHSYFPDLEAIAHHSSLRSTSVSSRLSFSSLQSLSDLSHSSTPSLAMTPSSISTADSSPESTSPQRKVSHKHCSWCGHSGHQKQTCRDLTKAFKDGIVHARKGKICLGRPGDGGEPIPYPHGEKTLRDWVWKRREMLVKERSGLTNLR